MGTSRSRRRSQRESEPAPVVRIQEREFTVVQFARTLGSGPIPRSFLHVEKLDHRLTRKMTLAAWKAEYAAFLRKPR